jgi:hypothetical protein
MKKWTEIRPKGIGTGYGDVSGVRASEAIRRSKQLLQR